MSSAVSSSSQGSGHDDVDAVGHVYMWGEGIGDGVLGGGSHKLGQSLGAKVDATLPKAVESAVVLDVQHVACGSRHAALVTRQGEIFCWGEELGGRLGHGIDADFAHPQLIETLAHMTIGFTSCGEYSSCAVSLAGELFTWGEDTHAIGLLGRGNGVGHWLPKRVGGPLEGLCVVMISCGPWHTALVTSLGQLFTFGDGTFGVLGHGDLQSISVPKEVESLKGLQTIKVSCGVWHSAAVVEVIESSNPCSNCSPRKLFTWGDGDKGRLGHEDKKQKLVPTCVAALIEHNFRDVACGHSLTAGLTLSGQVFTMGSTVYGQLGNPNADGKAPALVEKLHDVFIQEIACGAFHFVALTSKGEVYTWGKGANGQLGHGDSSDRKVPTLVEALKDKEVKSISCGGSITAAICLHKWVSGSDQSVCSGCKQPFGFTRKKHNCYNCGLVLCHSCSSKKAIKASMAPNPIKPHRVCDSCYIKMKKANYSTMSPSSASVNKRLGSLKPYVGNRHLQDVMDPTLLKSEPSSSKLSTLEKSKLNENKIHSEKSKRFESKNSRFSPSQTRPSLRSGYVRQYISASVPQSRIVSGATSPVASRRLSPCSIISTPTVDGMALAMMGDYDSIRIENLACEVTKLRLQVETLTRYCQLQDAKLKHSAKQLKRALCMAEDEAVKCRAAKDVIKSLTAQLKRRAETMPGDTHHQSQSASETTFTSEALPTVWNARGSRKTCSKKHQNIDDAKNLGNNGILSFYVHDSHGRERDSTVQASKIVQNDRSHTGYKSDDPSRREKSHLLVESEYEPGREWIEQAEPGVYITLVALPGGGKDLKRVRFSRKRFSEKQAEVWWRENKARVHELYDVRLTGTSATTAAAP